MTHPIRKVAVLGAGTMGAAIAAHCANAQLDVELLDIVAPTGDDRDAITRAGYERMRKARPAALMGDNVADRIRLGNFEDNLDRLADADWIIEAIVERVEPKQQLMQRVEKIAGPAAIISSNTSGIPLRTLAEGRSDAFRAHFLGTHFFNPPRYLKLVELIPTDHTDPLVVDAMRNFAERALGKGVVIARDTPDFIANRLGTFAGMQAIRYAFDAGYSIEEVDAITGPLIGRPSTATFRLDDQVGLDIAVGVAENIYPLIPDDESRDADGFSVCTEAGGGRATRPDAGRRVGVLSPCRPRRSCRGDVHGFCRARRGAHPCRRWYQGDGAPNRIRRGRPGS